MMWRLHSRLAWKQLLRFRSQTLAVLGCFAFSISALVAVNSFAHQVLGALTDDARRLQAADIVVRSANPPSAGLAAALADLSQQNRIAVSRAHRFYSMVRAETGDASILAQVKAVDAGYPFYGQERLASSARMRDRLRPGTTVVAQGVLDRLGVSVGDRLQLGRAVLRITDVITHEPDRPVDVFSFGPRVFVAAPDLPTLDLLQPGSRARYQFLIKLTASGDMDAVMGTLTAAASPGTEEIFTFQNAPSRIKRILDNMFSYLGLMSVFTLLLAGIGIQSALGALLAQQVQSIGIFKAVGADTAFIRVHAIAITAVLGGIGTLAGVACGIMLQQWLPTLFEGILPETSGTAVAWSAVAIAAGLGLGVAGLFAYLPIARATAVSPATIFRKEPTADVGPGGALLSRLAIGVFFSAVIVVLVRDLRLGLAIAGSALGLLAVVILWVSLVLALLRRSRPKALALRQALRGLFRPGNATRAILVALTAALTVIGTIHLVETNLWRQYGASYPPDAPNVYAVNILPHQADAVTEQLGPETQRYPIVRARISAINDSAVDTESERRQRRDNLAREFNLTFRESLLPDEELEDGETLFRSDWAGPQVSILDIVQGMHPMTMGDTIRFRIQGVPITATISSVRTRTRNSLSPFFYFVFPESVLAAAPKTYFAAARVPPDQVGKLQNRLVQAYPNMSIIDISDVARRMTTLMGRLSLIIRTFAVFGIGAGVLIMISAFVATRAARVRETVYYKILGATRRFIQNLFLLENTIMGTLAGLSAVAGSQGAAWLICTQMLDIGYSPQWLWSLGMAATAVAMVVILGQAAAIAVLNQRPAAYLASQQDG